MSSFLPFIVIGLTSGSVYALAGIGLVLTYKTSGLFNFAQGTIAALMAFAFFELRQRSHLPWVLAFVICVLVLSPMAGLILERLARQVADAPAVMKIVAVVGLWVAVQQALIIQTGGRTIVVHSYLPTKTFRIFGVNVGYDQAIVMGIALVSMLALTWLFVATRLGWSMRAVVDQPELLALTGTSPAKVRRRAWYIGASFAGLSGVLLAPTVGLDASVLTLLVISAFGAAAIGMFRSIPLTYLGGLIIGVLAALSTKYVGNIAWLSGVPASMPFIVLFLVLLLARRRWLVDFTVDRKAKVVESRRLPRSGKIVAGAVVAFVVFGIPYMVGTRLPIYSSALAYVIIFLSLALLIRTSGQVSLAQLTFAAVGAVAFGRLAASAGVPWVAAVLIGALIAVPVGALLAIPAVRRSGLFLALASFGFAVLFEQLVYPTNLFGGSEGNLPAPRPSFASGDKAYYYLLLAFVAASIVLVTGLQRGRLGRLMRAMADSPTALNTSGMSVTAVKVIVFCVSAFLAGLGGALLGPVTGTASPAQTFSSLIHSCSW